MAIVNKFIDTETEPDLICENFEVLYTDSARLTMKMRTPLLQQFSSANNQREEFPVGAHVWFYEKTGELHAEITTNWAQRDIATNLWEARSNVIGTFADGRKIETEQLFFDPQKGIVYSEKYTKITNEDGTVATGDTFWALQDFSEYRLGRGKATIMLSDEK